MDKNLDKAPIIQLKNITKRFGDNQVLTSVNFDLHKGEVHALLGENGAGKTTLMNVLYGMFPPTEGEIIINGKKYIQMTPKQAIENNIGMVHQHFMLVEPFTVTQNIILGQEITKGSFLDYNVANKKVKELSEKYGLRIDPESKIQDISVGMQQRVEILKALYRGADILIFDEPTAVLTPSEIDEFIEIVENLTKLDKSIIIITHKLSEIKAMADTCTVIRRGVFIDKLDVKKVDENILAEKMVGRDVSFKVDKKDRKPGEVLLKIEDLVVEDQRGLNAVDGLNLTLKRGEILGIAGVDGNGQSELIDAITGLTKIKSGKVTLNGKDITNKSPREIIDGGMNNIPEDRQKRGLILDYSIADNLILENVNNKPFSEKGILKFKEINQNAKKLVEDFDIRPTNIHENTRNLSGGNQQKVIIAREIYNDPDVLIAAQPTRGLDVGAIEFIHRYLVEQRNNDKAVLLVSFELDEVMDLSDRIAIIYDGKIVGEKNPKNTDEYEIGRLMAGGSDGK
ncbi:MAG: ABC transporter ATP-binding protein [Tissierellia bacterium]|nr:ABC transporter ATP-binding protein [Tissierellia bacterium]